MGFKRSSGYLIALMAGNLVIGVLATVIVARHLGTEGKGVIHLVILLPQFVSSVGGLGVRAAAIYYGGRGRSPLALFRIVVTVGLTISVIYAGAGWLLRDLLAASILKGLAPGFIVVALALIPLSILWLFCDGVLQGLFQFGAYALIQFLALVLKLSLLVVFLVVMDRGIAWGVTAYALAIALPALFAVGWARVAANRTGTPIPLREFLGYGLRVYWGTLALRANLRLDSFLVNPYVGTAAVGIYSVSTTFAELIWQVPGAVSQVLVPTVAAGSQDEAIGRTTLVSRIMFAFTLVAALGLALLGKWVLAVLFPPEFGAALLPLLALLPGVVALSLSMTMSGYLTGTGKPGMTSTASLISFVVNIPALFLLVPRLGILGASIASSLAYITQTAVVVYFCRRESGVPVLSMMIPRRADFAEVPQMVGTAWRRLRAG